MVLPNPWFNLAQANQYCSRAAALKATANGLAPGTRLLTGPFTSANQNADLLRVCMLGGVPFCGIQHFLTGVPVTVAHFFSVIQLEINGLGYATECKGLTN